MTSLGVKNIECRTDGSKIDPTHRVGYIFNSGIAGIEEADAILLIGTNPKKEAALVNARIRKTWLEKQIPIALIGTPVDLPYPYHHAGTTADDIVKLAKTYAKKVNTKKPMIIVSDQVFARNDGAALHAALYDVAEQLGCVQEDEDKGAWNGFNVLHRHAGRVGALDVGFTSGNTIKTEEMDVIYLLNSDEENILTSCNKKSFVIYQGHHGDLGAHRADVILPAAAYTEKNAMFVNTEGRVQLAKQAVFPVGDAKEDWKILRALSSIMERTLPYNSLVELRTRISSEWSHFANIDALPNEKWKRFGKKGALLKAPFKNTIDNYYMTNVICRASQTMQDCTDKFVAKKTTQKKKKAAE